MTEEELTKLAMMKAEAEKKHQQRTQKETKLQSSQTEKPKEQKNLTPEEILELAKQNPEILEQLKSIDSKDSEYINETILGDNKIIHWKEWTGKTRKKLRKLMNDISEEIVNFQDEADFVLTPEDFEKILDVVIYDNIKEKDTFLSDTEQQYLLLQMKEKSIEDKFYFSGNCPNCGSLQLVESSISESVNYKKSKYPYKSKLEDIVIVDISSRKEFKSVIEEYKSLPEYNELTTDADIEMAMHLDIKGLDNSVIGVEKKMQYMDNLSLKELKILLDELSESSAKIAIKGNHYCSECNTDIQIEANEVPNILEDILQ